MPISIEQKQEEFLAWLETEPELHKLLFENNGVIEAVYRLYFELGFGFSPNDAAIEVYKAQKLGLAISVKTGRGTLRAVVDPRPALIDCYFDILADRVGQQITNFADYIEISSKANAGQKNMAKDFCVLYLVNFVNKLREELAGVMWEASRLSKIKMAEQAGADFSLRKEIEKLGKQTEKRRKREAGVGAGGRRERKDFSWDQEKKIAFFKQVEETPKIDGIKIWEYARAMLIKNDFDSGTGVWLFKRPSFKNIDKRLFNEAFNKWRDHEERLDGSGDEFPPRLYEYRQAMINLGYPDKYKYSTMHTHYKAGKTASNFQS